MKTFGEYAPIRMSTLARRMYVQRSAIVGDSAQPFFPEEANVPERAGRGLNAGKKGS
jgi:hypothetical protein